MEILLFLLICNFHNCKIQFHGNKTRSHIVQNNTLVKQIQILHVSIIVYHTFLQNTIHNTFAASKCMAHHVKILLLHVTVQDSL
jgi:hypothetical protein